MSDVAIHNVSSDLHIAACFAVMRELRPQLADADELVRRVRVQAAQGYVLASAFWGDACIGCVGYRLADNRFTPGAR